MSTPKQFVQIINEQEVKAVRFPFNDSIAAEKFAADLNAVFSKHGVNSVIGSYGDGEVCPRHKVAA